MISEERIRDALPIEDSFSVNIWEGTQTDTPEMKDFNDMGLIETDTQETTRVQIMRDNEELGCMTYVIFPLDKVGYIKDTYITEEYQNQNIGTSLREIAIEDMEQKVDYIYSYPTNDIILHIISEKQDFEKYKSGFYRLEV